MARQTKERAEQTREDILDAATRVFFKHGVARSSLDEVARAAGVTRGAVYWHFRDKSDLFAGIEGRLRLTQDSQLTALAQSSPRNALGELERLIVSMLHQLDTDQTLRIQMTVVNLRLDLVDELAPALERQAEFHQRFSERLRAYFEQVVPTPGAGCDWTPATAALVLHALVHGTVLRALRFPTACPIPTDGIPVIQAFMAALRSNWSRGVAGS